MITDFLVSHRRLNAVSFHMPGHKGEAIYRKYGFGDFLDGLVDCDVTEITGADNLFQPEGIIKSTMREYAELYGVKSSYLLINGTSGGIIASILACVRRGKKLIMARNCHKSVFNGLSLAGALPVYAYTEMRDGISGPVSAQEIEMLLRRNADADAVILASPNYYGFCSDIRSIADVCHRYDKILIVDQAHGAHLKFFSQYAPGSIEVKSAEECGADIIVNSTHKTLASFTQSAVLNVNSDRVDIDVLLDKLQMIQSSSPSYLLMASLDINARLLKEHGRELICAWASNVSRFYEGAKSIPAMKLVCDESLLDKTKLNIDMSAYGMDGATLSMFLEEKNIFGELSAGDILMCMTGIGNSREDIDKLLYALRDVCKTRALTEKREDGVTDAAELWNKRRTLFAIPEKRGWTPLEGSEGRICASSIIPYPPGIPFLCPGERIEKQEIEFIKALRKNGKKVIGVNEKGQVLTEVF